MTPKLIHVTLGLPILEKQLETITVLRFIATSRCGLVWKPYFSNKQVGVVIYQNSFHPCSNCANLALLTWVPFLNSPEYLLALLLSINFSLFFSSHITPEDDSGYPLYILTYTFATIWVMYRFHAIAHAGLHFRHHIKSHVHKLCTVITQWGQMKELIAIRF